MNKREAVVLFSGVLGIGCFVLALAGNLYGIGALLHGRWTDAAKGFGVGFLTSVAGVGSFIFSGWYGTKHELGTRRR